MNRLMRWFAYQHLPEGGPRNTSKMIHDVAVALDNAFPESAEKTAGFRKLIEAKDCLVRAAIEADEAQSRV